MSERKPAKVSSLVRYLKNSLEGDPRLGNVMVEGEISNLRMPGGRHWYFSLKDESASISCVMFASRNAYVSFRPKDGDKIILTGSVSVYEPGGTLQIIATSMRQSGIGDLYQQFELLKKKLAAEGLFDEDHKKPLPPYPMDIGLITGDDTAGRKDVLITLYNRWPAANLHEYPTQVQGKDAAPKILASLMKAEEAGHDVILLVRGGGSIEQLWCFNDETLARYIYIMNTPIVTGIGHETDFTLCDFVADVRANTPTGAVEKAVPDHKEVRKQLENCYIRMYNSVSGALQYDRDLLDRYAANPVFRFPERLYSEEAQKLATYQEKLMRTRSLQDLKRSELQDLLQRFYGSMNAQSNNVRKTLHTQESRMKQAVKQTEMKHSARLSYDKDRMTLLMNNDLISRQNAFAAKVKLLDAYSPLKVMERGYSVVYDGDHVVNSIDEIEEKARLRIRMTDGFVNTEAVSKEKLHG